MKKEIRFNDGTKIIVDVDVFRSSRGFDGDCIILLAINIIAFGFAILFTILK